MRKNRKRFLSLALTVLLVLTNTQITAFGAQESASPSEIIPEGVVLNYHEGETVDSSFANESKDTWPVRGNLPASYSASSNIPSSIVVAQKADHVAPVKNQNPYGTCWAHAAISIAESSYIVNQEVKQTESYRDAFVDIMSTIHQSVQSSRKRWLIWKEGGRRWRTMLWETSMVKQIAFMRC